MSRWKQRGGWFLLSSALMLTTTPALAGDLDAPASPSDSGSAMFTLEDLYKRLNDGTAGAKRSGAFTGPVAAPGSTMHTLNDIMIKAPALDGSAATAAEVVAGKTFWGLSAGSNWGVRTGSMINVSPQNITPSTAPQTITKGYHDGTGTVTGDANLVSANIKSGATIFGVGGDTNVVDTSSGDAAASDMLSGKKAWVAGAEVTGSITSSSGVTITPSASDQSIAAGYYTSASTVAGDADLTDGHIRSGVTVFGKTGTFTTAIAKRVNKTGQTACWDADRNSIDCAGTGQDGEYQYGLDPAVTPSTNGSYNSPASTGTRFIDNNNGTVTDTLTALIWQKGNNTVSCSFEDWQGALNICNTLATGNCGLTDGSVAGNWRLPNINELHSLGPIWPPSASFGGNLDSNYWSSTTKEAGVGNAWVVFFDSGNVTARNKLGGGFVRCVRGGQ